jgi:hypothetical protein
MADTSDERPRPTPHARPTRPTPRPRVAGSRRDRDEVTPVSRPVAPAAASSRRAASSPATPSSGRRISALALTLVLLCVAAAAGLSVLLWLRSRTTYVDPSIFSAARSGIQALYAYDYKDSEGSVQGKLDVLTGELRDQYETDLSQGGIIDTYEQVSATTSYEVLDVGLQQVNESQDTATLVVFGKYVVGVRQVRRRVGEQRRPAGPRGLGVRGHARGRPGVHPDGPAPTGPGGRRVEDQRAHPADHELSSTRPGGEGPLGPRNRGVAAPHGASGWHHGRGTTPRPVPADRLSGMWRR